MRDLTISVFIAVSLDGNIARLNGNLDWLENAAPENDTEDYGYQKYISTVDCIVMGRKTFEKVASFSKWPYVGKRVIVVSRVLKEAPADFVDKVETYGGKIQMLPVELQYQGVRKVYLDGGLTIQSFLRCGLIDEMTITQIPVLIGRGISLFGELNKDIKLKLMRSQSFASGFVQSHYQLNIKSQ